MNIDKIRFAKTENATKTKNNTYQYNPMYLKSNSLKDSVSFSGDKNSRKLRRVLAARIATVMLALSSVFNTVSCSPQQKTNNEATATQSKATPLVDYDLNIDETLESEEPETIVIYTDNYDEANQGETKIKVDETKLAPSEFDYTNILENDVRLLDHIELDNNTTSTFELGEKPAVKRYNSDNIGSATVITTYNKDIDEESVEGGSYIIPEDVENYTVLDLINDAYGELNTNEKNSAAWAIVDNSSDILKEVNKTYLTVQMAEQFKEDLSLEENIPLYALSAIKDIASGGLDYENEDYAFLNLSIDELEGVSEEEYENFQKVKEELETLNSKNEQNEFEEIDEKAIFHLLNQKKS